MGKSIEMIKQALDSHDLVQLKELILRRNLTLAVAESLTSGNIQVAIGSISGASNFFEGGVTAYNINQKVALLGVDKNHAEQVNCVSSRVAREMAEGVCKRFGSVLGLATTGYAEPAENAEFPDPYAYFAIWHQFLCNGYVVREDIVKMPGATRVEVQHGITQAGVLALLDYLKTL
jgi:nicotinamide-nucleotide amidase